MLDAQGSGAAFAERLGSWIHFTDAITLAAVHSEALRQVPGSTPEIRSTAARAAAAEFDRVHALLQTSIINSCSYKAGKTHIRFPLPTPDLAADSASAYAPYHRFYQAHQRDMELSIQPLRTNVRAALGKTSPRLAKLAELDATLEIILRERESKLLATLPLLLKKRYMAAFTSHQQVQAASQHPDNPAAWTRAGGWLADFCTDMQTLLLAELDLRLQPTTGLIEAMTNTP